MTEHAAEAMVVHESTTSAVSHPMPMMSGEAMKAAFKAYKELQQALDESMQDQIMEIGEGANKKKFRKKGYWRALATAFNLDVKPTEDRREVGGHFGDGRENFGYVVTYRATSPNGRSAIGDGACFAVEKAPKFRCPHKQPDGKSVHWGRTLEDCPSYNPDFAWLRLPDQSTEHNIRSHAHTRAFNRAVSNLVGFGEVSAEEVDRNGHDGAAGRSESSTAGNRSNQDARQSTAKGSAAKGKTEAPKADTSWHKKGRAYVADARVIKESKPDDAKQWKWYGVAIVKDGATTLTTTFDTKLYEAACDAIKDKMPVEFKFSPDKKYPEKFVLDFVEPVFYREDDVEDSTPIEPDQDPGNGEETAGDGGPF